MQSTKKAPSKIKIVLVSAILITLLIAGPRISMMSRVSAQANWQFDWFSYTFLIVNTFGMAVIFLTLNMAVKPLTIGGFILNMSDKWIKVGLNVLLFLLIHFLINLFISQIRDFTPFNRPFGFLAIGSNLILVLSTVIIAWVYRLLVTNYEMYIKNEQLQKKQAETKFEVLKSQINPHFLFNSFYTINGLIGKNPQLAMEFVNDMSDVYRYVLQSSKANTVSLKEELHFFEAYSAMLKKRFNKAIIIEENIALATLVKKVPPLSIQILLENAIKHNNFNEKCPLRIRIESNGEQLTLANTLNQREVIEKSANIGLYNLNHRYKHLSNREIAIRKSETEFTVTLPLLDHENSHN